MVPTIMYIMAIITIYEVTVDYFGVKKKPWEVYTSSYNYITTYHNIDYTLPKTCWIRFDDIIRNI